MKKRTKNHYSPEDLNYAADLYRRAVRLIEAGESTPDIIRAKDQAGLQVLKMVEPLLLVYFRFLSGQSDKITADLGRFLSLFQVPGREKDQATLLYQIRAGLQPYFNSGREDSTCPDSVAIPFEGCEVYSWFTEIIFATILPNYKVRYTDDKKRINFFRFFQLQFCYSIADRVKQALGWEGRRRSLESMEEDEGFVPSFEVSQHDVRAAAGFLDIEWSWLLKRSTSRRQKLGRAAGLMEDQIRCRLSGLRTSFSTAR